MIPIWLVVTVATLVALAAIGRNAQDGDFVAFFGMILIVIGYLCYWIVQLLAWSKP